MRNGKLIGVCLVGLMIGGWFAANRGLTAQEQDPDVIAQRDFMRTKLMYTQNIVEGLSTGRFALIASSADEIQRITEAGIWTANNTPEFVRWSNELRETAGHLKKAADKGNLEAATLRYFELTLKCIDCHQHLRKADF